MTNKVQQNFKMTKHLHVFTDEKWTNNVVKQFLHNNEISQDFVVILGENKINIKYDIEKELPIEIIQYKSVKYHELISHVNNYHSVFIHFLCELKYDLIEHVQDSSNLIWMCWGQDIHKMIISDSYMPETRKLLWRMNLRREYFWKYNLWLRQLKHPFTRRGKILKKFNYCCPVIFSDLNDTNKIFNLSIKYLPFHYSTLETMLGSLIDSKSKGINILVGNSSTFASNHLDVFKKLKNMDLGNANIIVPLSYGDSQYGNKIEYTGKLLFGQGFTALKEFLKAEEYNKILQSCSIAIFNHIRQQALGNIIICLWLGIKVYLNEKSNLYRELKSMKLPIFSIQSDLSPRNKIALKAMNEKELKISREILLAEFGKNNTQALTSNIFEVLNSNQKK